MVSLLTGKAQVSAARAHLLVFIPALHLAPAHETQQNGLQVPHVTWLTCRRTYSSWAHEKGVPAKIVAQLMGHANVDTTLNVYTQVLDASVREAAATVGRIVHDCSPNRRSRASSQRAKLLTGLALRLDSNQEPSR
jgi:hypothetical protein